MASWIVHLRVADRLLDRIAGLEQTPFIVGNIGPDCGAITDVPGEYDPPNRITHYSPGGRKRDCQTWRFRDEYLPDPEPGRHSFYLGYYVHLWVDRLWFERIFRPIETAHAAYFAEDPMRVFSMKQDWYDQDARFLRDHPAFRAFRMLCAVQDFPNTYLDFYGPDVFTRQIRYIAQFYAPTDRNLEREYRFLDQPAMDGFVDGAAADILQTLQQEGLDSVPAQKQL